MDYKLYKGDCLEVMDRLIEEGVKVNMVLTDPPYGTTQNKWDSIIPLLPMWKKLELLTNEKTIVNLITTTNKKYFSQYNKKQNVYYLQT